MNIPKELLGKEAKPLIGMIGGICTYANPMSKVVILTDFLNQDFTPDMIEKYFGIKIYEYQNRTVYCMLVDHKFYRYKDGTIEIENAIAETVFYSAGKITLNDFIAACKNSGITLTYQEAQK